MAPKKPKSTPKKMTNKSQKKKQRKATTVRKVAVSAPSRKSARPASKPASTRSESPDSPDEAYDPEFTFPAPESDSPTLDRPIHRSLDADEMLGLVDVMIDRKLEEHQSGPKPKFAPDADIKFEFDVNQDQYKFNTSQFDRLGKVRSLVGKCHGGPAALGALKILDEAQESINLRQKHIRIQDSHGRGTLKWYKGADITSDDQDAKRLRQSKRLAKEESDDLQRKKSKPQAQQRPPFPAVGRPSGQPFLYDPYRQFNLGAPAIAPTFQSTNFNPNFGQTSPFAPFGVQFQQPQPPRRPRQGTCHTCGEAGHFFRECPRLLAIQSRGMQPDQSKQQQ